MKKLIYCAAALVTALFAGSCQRELLDTAAQGNTVTYTVNMPEVATKAGESNLLVEKLVYAVYRVRDSKTSKEAALANLSGTCEFVYQYEQDVTGTRNIVSLELINNQKYVVAFWAQNDDMWFEHDNKTTDNKGETDYEFAIEGIDLTKYRPNTLEFDAFSGVDFIEVNGSASKGIELKRPFAQLNIATNLPKTFAADVKTTKVTVNNVARSYNVVTNVATVDNTNPVVFEAKAPLSTEYTSYDKYISMNYVFVPEDRVSVTVSYEIETEAHGTVTNTIDYVPLARNYKTNIVGNLLTSKVDYDVEIKNDWGTPNNEVPVVDADNIQAILDNAVAGTTIQLKKGVNYGTIYIRPTAGNIATMKCEFHEFTTSDVEAYKAHLAEGPSHSPRYTSNISNITIIGAEGAVIEGVQISSSHKTQNATDYVVGKDINPNGHHYAVMKISNLKFENVNFTGKIDINSSEVDAEYDGITFEGCTFTTGGTAEANGAAIRYYNEANNGKVRNITVNNCTFNNCRQGVYVHHVNGITITDNTFENTGHNAIGIQGHTGAAVNLKNVVITGNTFNKIGDRIIRFNEIGADSNITIQNNVATNSGDEDSEVIKATSIADGVVTSVKNNHWGVGKIVVNDELKDKVMHAESGLYYNGINQNHKSVFYVESAEDLRKAAAYFTGQTHSNEANYVTIELLTNIDLAGQDWTPWSVQYLNLNGNNFTISNMNVPASWRGGLFGYGGPVKVNDLTIKNATVSGAQAGILIGSAEGATVNNVKIAGNNTVTYVPYSNATYTEAWGGIGVVTGVINGSTINTEIVAGATVEINTNGIETDAPYVDIYTGYIQANNGAVVDNGTVKVNYSVDTPTELIAALKAVKDNSTIYLTDDITVTDNWDARYSGGKTTKPIVIDGNGNTLKLTGNVTDDNHNAVFRFENDAKVKNLTIDLSDAANTGQMRAISCKSTLSVENCTFIGKSDVNSRGIIFGEGANPNFDFEVSIKNSTFTNWKRGITDNENAQDIKSVTVENNTFTNANVNLSAYDSIVFNKNTMINSYVDLRTYTPSSTLTVIAQENTLDSAWAAKNLIVNCVTTNVNAQEGFTIQ